MFPEGHKITSCLVSLTKAGSPLRFTILNVFFRLFTCRMEMFAKNSEILAKTPSQHTLHNTPPPPHTQGHGGVWATFLFALCVDPSVAVLVGCLGSQSANPNMEVRTWASLF